jgi:hypothetical protein
MPGNRDALSQLEYKVPSASFVFAAERDAGVRTAALLALQPSTVCDAIEARIAAGFIPYRNADGFGIPYTAHVVAA